MARVFVYDGREFPDPDPNLKVDDVRQNMANFFPELSNAETKESKRPSATVAGETETVIEFKKRVGTKGNFRQVFTTRGEATATGLEKAPCRLGSCLTKNTHYQGGDATVMAKLKDGICPICGGPTERKYGED